MEELVVSLGRDALRLAALISAPILTICVIVGLVLGVIQTATQIQDQTISIVIKAAVILIVTIMLLPWGMTRLVEYSSSLFENIPANLTGGL